MTASIEVECREAGEGWLCSVTVDEAGSESRHDVRVSREELQRLAPSVPVERLVEESFRFLLQREPKESILSQFEISVISRYFPEYASEIAERLGPGRAI